MALYQLASYVGTCTLSMFATQAWQHVMDAVLRCQLRVLQHATSGGCRCPAPHGVHVGWGPLMVTLAAALDTPACGCVNTYN
jgi:hypothetical protein